jgi:2-polyprenyl-3-methyl-5-hydroxy-6-metoxy-1,4-benzoquinol methylase
MITRGKPAAYGQEIVLRRFRLAQKLSSFENKTVLDFGCGNGAQTAQFAQAGCKILAVDIDDEDLKALRRFLDKEKVRTIQPVRYDGARLPLAEGSVDLVLSFEVLEHVPDEAVALREIHRVLKPHGEIIFSVPNKGWLFETHGAHLPLLAWNRVPFFSWLPHFLHRRFAKARIYRKRDIVRLLQRHGFEILAAQYVTAPMDVLKSPRLKQLARGLFFRNDTTRQSFLATAILAHGRKV